MIAIALDLSELRTTTSPRRMEYDQSTRASRTEIRAPDRVTASQWDPVAEMAQAATKTQASHSIPSIPHLDVAWTSELERKFLDLAGLEAVGGITAQGRQELERLSSLRRSLRNPRSGEELLLEYEQRRLTKDLLAALDSYVTFHNPTSRSKASAS